MTYTTGSGATPAAHRGDAESEVHRHSSGAVGVVVLAATLMVLVGTMEALQGLAALLNDEFFVIGASYTFAFDVTAWGWIHLLLGLIVLMAGFALLQGATWARAVAVVMASLSIVANFLWAPYYPIWSLTLIAFNVFVIWAATMHGRDILDD